MILCYIAKNLTYFKIYNLKTFGTCRFQIQAPRLQNPKNLKVLGVENVIDLKIYNLIILRQKEKCIKDLKIFIIFYFKNYFLSRLFRFKIFKVLFLDFKIVNNIRCEKSPNPIRFDRS